MPERSLPYRPPELEDVEKPSRVERGRRPERKRHDHGEPVPGRAVHRRGQVPEVAFKQDTNKATESPVVEKGAEAEDDLQATHKEYNETYQLLEILLAEHPNVVRPKIPYDSREIPLDKALRLIDADITKTVAQYEASEREDYDVALGNIKSALEEVKELKEIFLTAVAEYGQSADEIAKTEAEARPEIDAEAKSKVFSLEENLKKWEEIRTVIRDKSDAARFEKEMRSLPIPELAKKNGIAEVQKKINRLKRILDQGKVLSDQDRDWIDNIDRDLKIIIPAGGTIFARLEFQQAEAAKKGVKNPERNESEGADGIPTESLGRADALITRWNELGREVGANRIIDRIKEKYPEPEFRLPYVKAIKKWLDEHRDPKAWKGRWAAANRQRLADELEQLEGIVGDAEKIAAEIREKEAPAQSRESEFKDLSLEDAVARLSGFLNRWNELKSSYGDGELREMMFQDRGPDFPPLERIKDWFARRDKWKAEDEELLRQDALPKMTVFIARAEAAAQKLQPKKKTERPTVEKKVEVEPASDAKAKVVVLATGRPIESDKQMTAWEKLDAEKARSFREAIMRTEFNDFQIWIRQRLSEEGVTNSSDRSQAAQAALGVVMPKRVRALAAERNIEITDDEIEKAFMSNLRKLLFAA